MEQKLSPKKIKEKQLIRTVVFNGIYSLELGGTVDTDFVDTVINISQEKVDEKICLSDKQKIEVLNKIHECFDKKDSLDELTKKFLVGWKMDRISIVDLSIIRMSVYDLLYTKDVPHNVIISEAVLLSSIYCDDKSKKFINGILSSLLENIISNSDSAKTV